MAVGKEDLINLFRLNFIEEETSKKDALNKQLIVSYRLTKQKSAMLDTARKYGFFKLRNYDKLGYLDLAKTAVIISHASGGMVDFKYDGINYTVRLKTSYNFFVHQYNLSKESNSVDK